MKPISKNYKNKDHECEKDRYRKRNESEINKRHCVHNTHDTNTLNTIQINQQQQVLAIEFSRKRECKNVNFLLQGRLLY